jgi:hypothetical protein
VADHGSQLIPEYTYYHTRMKRRTHSTLRKWAGLPLEIADGKLPAILHPTFNSILHMLHFLHSQQRSLPSLCHLSRKHHRYIDNRAQPYNISIRIVSLVSSRSILYR